jgi:hypothetical protein
MYLNQFVPNLAKKIMLKSIAKQYAVQNRGNHEPKNCNKISPAE